MHFLWHFSKNKINIILCNTKGFGHYIDLETIIISIQHNSLRFASGIILEFWELLFLGQYNARNPWYYILYKGTLISFLFQNFQKTTVFPKFFHKIWQYSIILFISNVLLMKAMMCLVIISKTSFLLFRPFRENSLLCIGAFNSTDQSIGRHVNEKW